MGRTLSFVAFPTFPHARGCGCSCFCVDVRHNLCLGLCGCTGVTGMLMGVEFSKVHLTLQQANLLLISMYGQASCTFVTRHLIPTHESVQPNIKRHHTRLLLAHAIVAIRIIHMLMVTVMVVRSMLVAVLCWGGVELLIWLRWVTKFHERIRWQVVHDRGGSEVRLYSENRT